MKMWVRLGTAVGIYRSRWSNIRDFSPPDEEVSLVFRGYMGNVTYDYNSWFISFYIIFKLLYTFEDGTIWFKSEDTQSQAQLTKILPV